MDKLFFVTLLAFTGLQLVLATVEIEVSPSPETIKQGDTVHIRCTITGGSPITLNKITRVINGQHYEIAQNNQLKGEFATDDRYRTEQSDDVVALSELVIEDVQGADSGRITCVEAGFDGLLEAAEDINVKVQPSNVDILVDGVVVPNMETLILTEDNPDPTYSCRVSVLGDFRQPDHIAMILDSEDIFEGLSKEPISLVQQESGYADFKFTGDFGQGPISPQLYNEAYQGKNLTCTAHTDPFVSVTSSVNLAIHYGPTAATDRCATTQYYKLGDAIEIVCVVRMFPPPKSSHWDLSQAMGGMDLNDITSNSHQALENSEYEYIMEVDEVSETLGMGVYTLEVTGEDDTITTFTITLEPMHVETTPTTTTTTTTESVTRPDQGTNTGKQRETGNSGFSATHSLCLLLISLLFTNLC